MISCCSGCGLNRDERDTHRFEVLAGGSGDEEEAESQIMNDLSKTFHPALSTHNNPFYLTALYIPVSPQGHSSAGGGGRESEPPLLRMPHSVWLPEQSSMSGE